MKILIVDDEERARRVLEIILRKLGETDLTAVASAQLALERLQTGEYDVAFLDIEMPQMSGLDLAEALLKLPKSPTVVFTTAYAQYAVQAWDIDAADYILKPFGTAQIQRALDRAKRRVRDRDPRPTQVEAKCFPTFELWIDGVPLMFGNRKAKELLAYLIHMQGAWVSVDRIIYALFEDSGEKNAKNYYRLLMYRLKQTLKEVGLEGLVESGYGKARVNPALFTCDYYRYLQGEKDLFYGEYLADYDWAEQLVADLRRKAGR